LFAKERERRPRFKLDIPSPGQYFVGHLVGGHTEEKCSPHGTSRYPTGLTGHGRTSSGRLQVRLLSRTPCFSSPTVWTDPEELDSVALQMSTDEACSTSTFFSYHVKNAMENITRSPLSVFGVCHMDDWLAHPTCAKVLMLEKYTISLFIYLRSAVKEAQ